MLNFTRKEVESLLHFVEEEPEAEKRNRESSDDFETVIYNACQLYPHLITKVVLFPNASHTIEDNFVWLSVQSLLVSVTVVGCDDTFVLHLSTATVPTRVSAGGSKGVETDQSGEKSRQEGLRG